MRYTKRKSKKNNGPSSPRQDINTYSLVGQSWSSTSGKGSAVVQLPAWATSVVIVVVMILMLAMAKPLNLSCC